MQHPNPLLCDIQTGVCETGTPDSTNEIATAGNLPKLIQIDYFTDPICSSCWGIEPQLRKLKLEYGHVFDIKYHMGGLLPSWEGFNGGGITKPSDVAHHWDEVSHYYEMPIDGDVWLEDPLPSSYPPSIAFKAAQQQDEGKALLFLRRIREMVFLEKKNITKWPVIEQAAKETGLDPVQLKTDFDGTAKDLFQKDLSFAREKGVRGFPTLFFSDSTGKQINVYGSKPYTDMEKAILSLLPGAEKHSYDTDWNYLFTKFSSLTTKEFAVLTGQSFSAATAQLDQLAGQHLLVKTTSKNGPIWHK